MTPAEQAETMRTLQARNMAEQIGEKYAAFATELRAKDPRMMTTKEVREIFQSIADLFEELAIGCQQSTAILDDMAASKLQSDAIDPGF